MRLDRRWWLDGEWLSSSTLAYGPKATGIGW
jgi:hypothetical protein